MSGVFLLTLADTGLLVIAAPVFFAGRALTFPRQGWFEPARRKR